MHTQEYIVCQVTQPPEMQGLWEGPAWGWVVPLQIACFRQESSSHRPVTQCKLLYSPKGVHGIFQVQDSYVRCVNTVFQSPVYKDSCVEFFAQPPSAAGYFNFEFNCGGALLASYVTNPTRVNGRIQECSPLPAEDDGRIVRFHSLPSMIEPELQKPVTWFLEFFIPFSIMEPFAGRIEMLQDGVWRGNFYKCGDETSHPHWSAWSPIDEKNFHLPAHFGLLRFA